MLKFNLSRFLIFFSACCFLLIYFYYSYCHFRSTLHLDSSCHLCLFRVFLFFIFVAKCVCINTQTYPYTLHIILYTYTPNISTHTHTPYTLFCTLLSASFRSKVINLSFFLTAKKLWYIHTILAISAAWGHSGRLFMFDKLKPPTESSSNN